MLVAGGIGQTPFLAVAREALGLRTYGTPPRVVSSVRGGSLFFTACDRPNISRGLEDFALPGLESPPGDGRRNPRAPRLCDRIAE